ncbi:Ca-activated chloride channel family protein [Nitrosomonas aestuarii]|uniref:Ca-activated chloride channel family protein n=1 Tax=Nitrosomonas aestuarii TaxID=52441 RepID=A0A1I4BGX2_9PROT|nr:VWA domain-containing protein [Nitrosomonas aestuarii]SFK68102.1 Ca-activated chloride channel family protein [Nitrosomonas aestuarii]
MSELHFLRPLWFLALIPALWLLITLWRKQSSGTAWNAVFDQQLLSHLWLELPGQSTRSPIIMLAAGWLLTIFILAGPVWERQPEIVWHSQMSRIVILDLSPSMNARDLAPSRLERARFKIMDILDRSKEGRTGLVVFAGEAHIVTPLTEDNKTIENLIGALNTEIMPVKGNQATPALQMAGNLLDLKGIRQGELLLISDGIDDPAAALVQARKLRKQGYTLSVLGIGTELGGAIMQDGITEVIRFNAAPLQELARAGGGTFNKYTTDSQDLNRLLPDVSAASNFDQMEGSAGGVERWVEHGVWLIPVIVLLAAISFRRGWLLGFAVLCIIPPPPVYAFGWQDLWLRADQQAQASLQQGDPQTAAQQFRNPDWRGTALYETGDYAAAAEAFAESDDIEALYNQGNALARAGDLQQAVEAYREVLQHNPAHDDAKANLELLEKLLQEQQQQSDDSSQQENESEENKKDSEDGTDSEGNLDQQQDAAQSENDGATHDTDKQNTEDTQSDLHQDTTMQEKQADEQKQVEQQEMTSPDDMINDDDHLPSEEDIALEQWLRQIPEDPSGLLRRKFMLEHMQRKQR